MNVGGLFDGCGLLAYGLHLAGLEHSWLCEVDPWRRELLGLRWPGVPVFNDVRAVGADTAERVDVIAGGFPCKGASSAGKRNGFDHPETVLWREMARAVRELRPRYVVVENVADILGLHDGEVWGEVVGDLAAGGYGVEWDCFPAAAFGAPHLRDRVIAIATHPDIVVGQAQQSRLRECGAMDEPGEIERPERLHRVPAAAADPQRGVHAPARCGDVSGAQGAREGEGPERQRIRANAPDGDAAPADAREGRWEELAAEHGAEPAQLLSDAERCGVAVEWGTYAAAIHRWEAVRGPAPKPLLRRVDDGLPAGVESSRLSALGDGVQVQLGLMVGTHLMTLEAS